MPNELKFVLVAAFVLAPVFLSHKVSQVFGLGRSQSRTLAAAWVAGIAFPLLLARVIEHQDTARWMKAFALLFGLTSVVSALALVGIDLLRWILSKLTKARSPNETQDEQESISRRVFASKLATAAVIPSGFGTAAYATLLGRHDYQIEEVPIPLSKLPRALDGYTLAQLSDIHVGGFVGDYELNAAIDLVRNARPDVLVITGDLVDHDPAYIPKLGEWIRKLSNLNLRDGVVVIPGNHDHYTGTDLVLDAAKRAGARVLRNQHLVIGDASSWFLLGGVDDIWTPRWNGQGTDLAKTFRDSDPDLARVLLCHNPEFFKDSSEYVDLQLSGHTHGGQVNVGGVNAAQLLGHPYVKGHYFRGPSQLYVNRGFGTAILPARLGAPPELSKIVLISS